MIHPGAKIIPLELLPTGTEFTKNYPLLASSLFSATCFQLMRIHFTALLLVLLFRMQAAGQSTHPYNGLYKGDYLQQIAFPIGGMGAGMFCLEGTGAISHMSVRHNPDVFNEPEFFAAIAVKGETNKAKIVEGPVPDWKKFGRPNAGNGSGGETTGLPRFEEAVFEARFPFA